jgi:hypothetical protein
LGTRSYAFSCSNLGIAVYAALELEPEQIARRVLFGVGGLAICAAAVLGV